MLLVPVEVAHVATLGDIVLLLLRLPDGLLCQPLLVLLQLLLVCRRHKLLLVAKQVVLHLSLLRQPALHFELTISRFLKQMRVRDSRQPTGCILLLPGTTLTHPDPLLVC